MKPIYFIFILLALSSCGPSHKLQSTPVCEYGAGGGTATVTCSNSERVAIDDPSFNFNDSFKPVALVFPCSGKSGRTKQLLIPLEDGRLLEAFSNVPSGIFTHVITVSNGVYQDLNGGCSFRVTTSGNMRAVYWPEDGFVWNTDGTP